MRGFIVLCLVAVACGDELGYNYKPAGHRSNNVLSVSGLNGGSNLQGVVQGVQNSGARSNTALSFSGVQGVSNLVAGSNVMSSHAVHHSSAGQASHDNAAYAPQVTLEKEYFTFTANEDDFQEPAATNQIQNTFKQGLRVIFIKGPENRALENAALSLAKHTAEQKTAIYVLHKQADLSSLSNKLNVENSNVNNKPEVHFVKYRTPEDAINAQKAIQQQYESLGGTSQTHEGGVAPVLNFASQAPVASHGVDGFNGVGVGSLSAGSLGAGLFGAGSLAGDSLGAGSLGGDSLGAGSLGGGTLGLGSFSFGSNSGSSNVGASYIPPTIGSVVTIPGQSYLPASHRLRL